MKFEYEGSDNVLMEKLIELCLEHKTTLINCQIIPGTGSDADNDYNLTFHTEIYFANSVENQKSAMDYVKNDIHRMVVKEQEYQKSHKEYIDKLKAEAGIL
jgi:hypothetical protein